MKPRLLIISVLMALASSQSHSAENLDSGNYLYQGCKVASEDEISSKLSLNAGVCIGTMTTILNHGKTYEICIPKGVSFTQAIRILVKYMDDNPQHLHKKLADLAVAAFRKHWAC